MKGVIKMVALALLIALGVTVGVPAVLVAVGSIIGILTMLWPVVLVIAILLIPGIIIGMIVKK